MKFNFLTIALIAILLLGVTGCVTSRDNVPQTEQRHTVVLRPPCCTAGFRAVGEASQKYIQYWNDAIAGDQDLTQEQCSESAKILNDALCGDNLSDDIRSALEYNRIQHGHNAFLLASHVNFIEPIIDADDMASALVKAKLVVGMRQANAKSFGGWLAQQEEWERVNGDWGGIAWASLFMNAKPVQALPDLWLSAPDDNTAWANADMRAWRASNGPAFKLSAAWIPQMSGKSELWIRQLVERPAINSKVYKINFRSFPGKCTIFINGKEKYNKSQSELQTFSVPVSFTFDNQCLITIRIYDVPPTALISWPVWLSAQN